MAENLRVESIERRERVKAFAIMHMEQTSTFPTARAIQTKFLESQYPGNLNSIASDLKTIAKDISLVYQSKQTIDIDGAQLEIPKEVLEFAVKSYQVIELTQQKKFNKLESESRNQVKKIQEALDKVINEITVKDSEIKGRDELIKLQNKQIDEMNKKLDLQDIKIQEVQKEAHIFEFKTKELASKINNLKEEFSKLNSENKILKSNEHSLNQHIGQLESNNNALFDERQSQNEQINLLQSTIQSLEDKILSFEEKLSLR